MLGAIGPPQQPTNEDLTSMFGAMVLTDVDTIGMHDGSDTETVGMPDGSDADTIGTQDGLNDDVIEIRDDSEADAIELQEILFCESP